MDIIIDNIKEEILRKGFIDKIIECSGIIKTESFYIRGIAWGKSILDKRDIDQIKSHSNKINIFKSHIDDIIKEMEKQK